MKSINRSFRAPSFICEALKNESELNRAPQSEWLSAWLKANEHCKISTTSWNEVKSKLEYTLETAYVRLDVDAARVLVKTRCLLCREFDYRYDFQIRHAFLYLFLKGDPSCREFFELNKANAGQGG